MWAANQEVVHKGREVMTVAIGESIGVFCRGCIRHLWFYVMNHRLDEMP